MNKQNEPRVMPTRYEWEVAETVYGTDALKVMFYLTAKRAWTETTMMYDHWNRDNVYHYNRAMEWHRDGPPVEAYNRIMARREFLRSPALHRVILIMACSLLAMIGLSIYTN